METLVAKRNYTDGPSPEQPRGMERAEQRGAARSSLTFNRILGMVT
jgi:hypothetical protein